MLKDYKRVLKTAKRPTWDEFKRSSMLVGVGMLIIGSIGLVINLIFQLVGL